MLALSWPVFASSDGGLLDRISGSYTAPAKYCSYAGGEGKWTPCHPPQTECLVIKKLDERHARFAVYSPQAHESICEVTGIAEVAGKNRLTYTENNANEVLNYHKSFSIEVTGASVTFRYSKEPESGADTPFCGVGGRLDNIRFLIKDREALPKGAAVCGDYQVASTGSAAQPNSRANFTRN